MDLDRIVARWGGAGLPPVSAAAVVSFERRVATVPPVLKQLLSKANGMQPNTMDGELFRFWPIEEWETARDGYVVFADYSISAHEYAWHESNESVAIIGGDVPSIVAPTVDEFLKYYLDEPKRMFTG
jgi:hypothetical protein